MTDWVTEIHLRQTGGMSHEVAYTNALDAAEVLMSLGLDVTLKPTLPDMRGEYKVDDEDV